MWIFTTVVKRVIYLYHFVTLYIIDMQNHKYINCTSLEKLLLNNIWWMGRCSIMFKKYKWTINGVESIKNYYSLCSLSLSKWSVIELLKKRWIMVYGRAQYLAYICLYSINNINKWKLEGEIFTFAYDNYTEKSTSLLSIIWLLSKSSRLQELIKILD